MARWFSVSQEGSSDDHEWRTLLKRIASTMALTMVPVVLLAPGGMSTAAAQENLNAILQGQYAFTQIANCTNSSLPFVGLTVQPNAIVTRVPAAASGIYQFNGDGTGTLTFQAQTMNFNSPIPGIPVQEIDAFCNVTYTVAPGGSVTLQASCKATIAVGPGAGAVQNITGIEERLQLVQFNTMALLSSAAQPVVETITNASTGALVVDRTCHRSGVLSKLFGR